MTQADIEAETIVRDAKRFRKLLKHLLGVRTVPKSEAEIIEVSLTTVDTTILPQRGVDDLLAFLDRI